MVNDKKSTTALWLFVGVVLGLPLMYWIIFYFAALANVELSRDVFGALRGFGPTVAAIAALAYVGRSGTIRSLWASVIQWRVSGRI